MKTICKPFLWVSLAISLTACKTSIPETAEKPNIILIVADDLGWYDLSSYGNEFIETPHLDQLAADGMRFTDAYAPAPLCSASRASIITGLHPISTDITEHIHGNPPAGPDQMLATPPIAQQLALEHTTIAESLKDVGYETAFIGKWHLGGGPFTPDHQGFDLNIAGAWNGLPKSFFYPFFDPGQKPELQDNAKPGDYLTDVLTTHAMDFIKSNKDTTFFVNLNFYSPHVPIEGKEDLVEKYRRKRGADSAVTKLPNIHYAAMVESIDQNVGRIVQQLQELNLEKNTLILFTSDNGGLHVISTPAFIKHTPPTYNGVLREGKGFVYEGGIREPLVVKWPAVIEGKKVEQTPVTGQDFYNTIMDAVGSNARAEGSSLLPLFRGESMEDRGLLWHLPHYNHQGSKPSTAYREGDWKLIYTYEDSLYQLFNLDQDLAESNDLSTDYPEKLEDLKTKMDLELKRLKAKFPTPNPNYQPVN